MTTSGVTAWSMTARDVITAALQENTILPAGTEPAADEIADCIVRLNGMLKSWAARGVTMWREIEEEVTIPAATASIDLPAGVSEVSGARLVYTSTFERPMARYDRADYMALPNKAQAGDPIAFYASAGVEPTLYVWPVPTTEKTIKLEVSRITETVTDATETLDIPEMWQETVYANLAMRVAGLFGAELTDELVARARMLEQQLFDYDRPGSYFMGAQRA